MKRILFSAIGFLPLAVLVADLFAPSDWRFWAFIGSGIWIAAVKDMTR